MDYAFDIRQNPQLFKNKESQNSVNEYHQENQDSMEHFILTPRNFQIDIGLKVFLKTNFTSLTSQYCRDLILLLMIYLKE